MFTIFLLIVASIGWGVISSKRPKPLSVKTAKIERAENLVATVSAPGTIRAHDLVDIQAEVAGVVVDLPVAEGQTVRKGGILLKIDPLQAETDLASARARRAGAEADVKRIESSIAAAQANLARQEQQLISCRAEYEQAQITARRQKRAAERRRELLKNGTISTEEFEESEAQAKLSLQSEAVAKARVDQCKAEMRALELAVEEQRAQKVATEQNLLAVAASLRRTEDSLSKVTIVSPLDGTVVSLNVDVGERAVPGIQSNPQATLMTIANLSQIEAEIQVDETDIVQVGLGDKTEVEVDSLPDKKLEGEVSEIGMAPIQSGSSDEGKDFKVVVAIADPPDSLRIGMSCEAEITVDERADVLAVPIQALTIREVDVDTSGTYVPPPSPAEEKKAKEEKDKKAKAADKNPAANGAESENPGDADPVKEKDATEGKGGDNKASAADKDKKKDSEKKEVQGVFVLGKDGFAYFRPIEVGIMGETQAEVLGGIEEGEEVVTGPLKALRELKEWKLVRKSKEK
ncbi:HlyD family secretion protein [Candidatus Sumerlaeota bacterium]|nr:HlyD family secretion protein [Candidatus Sumerlaeota bacterium]